MLNRPISSIAAIALVNILGIPTAQSAVVTDHFNDTASSVGTAIGGTKPTVSDGVLTSITGTASAYRYDVSALSAAVSTTVEFWYRSTGDTTRNVLLQAVGADVNADTEVLTLYNTGNNLNLVLGGGYSVAVTSANTTAWKDGSWHHIAIVCETSSGTVKLSIYADGARLSTNTVNSVWGLAANARWRDLYIGGTPLVVGTDYRYPTSGDIGGSLINSVGQFDDLVYTDSAKYTGATYAVPERQIPEPATLGIMGISSLALLCRRR